MSDTEKREASAKRVRFQNIPRPFEDVLPHPPVKTGMRNPLKPRLQVLTDFEPEYKPTEDGMAGVSAGLDVPTSMGDAELLEELGGGGDGMVFEKVDTDGDGDPLAGGLSGLKLGRMSSDATWMVRRVKVLGASCGTPRPVSIGEDDERSRPFFGADSL